MTQKAITKLNGNTIGFVIILFVVTSVGSLSTEDSLSNEEGFLTTIGDDLSIAEETEGYTVTSGKLFAHFNLSNLPYLF